MLKVPNTTHCFGRYFCSSIYQIKTTFHRICFDERFAGTPQFFLEPRYANRKEIKVVIPYNDVSCIGPGRTLAPFFAKNHIDSGADFKAFNGEHDLLAFAQHCKDVFVSNSVASTCCPLLRVDIFESQCDMLMLNEIENLDAMVQRAGQLDAKRKRTSGDTDVKMEEFRVQFFEDKFIQLLRKFRDVK